MKVTTLKTSDIKPYKNNAKTHPKEQINGLVESINRFGFTQPLVIDKNNNLVIGHGRLEAAIKAGLKEVPVLIKDDLSESDIKALRLIDNRIAETGWDADNILSELDGFNYDFDSFNIDFDEFMPTPDNVGLTDDDEVPDEVDPVCKLGDLWILGDHRLLCGDSTKKEDVDKLMDGQKADMVFTDPPYGMNLDADYSKMSGNGRKGKKWNSVIGDDQDYDPAQLLEMFEDVEDIILWGADYYCRRLPEGGTWVVWDKTLKANGDAGYNSEFEIAWSKKTRKKEVLHKEWFRFFGLQTQDTKKRLHPTQKPIEIIEHLLSGNTVVDLFLGSGSTLIACEKTERNCYGMEIDPHYCDVIIKRWEDYTGKKAVLNG